MRTWQVQEAKQRFSEMLRGVDDGEEQLITRHGEPVAVVLSYENYRAAHRGDIGLIDFLLAAPVELSDEDLPPRVPEPLRAVELES